MSDIFYDPWPKMNSELDMESFIKQLDSQTYVKGQVGPILVGEWKANQDLDQNAQPTQ